MKITILLTALLALTACADEPDMGMREYCEMRQTWEQDKANGVIEIKRSGWPEFGDDARCTQLGVE